MQIWLGKQFEFSLIFHVQAQNIVRISYLSLDSCKAAYANITYKILTGHIHPNWRKFDLDGELAPISMYNKQDWLLSKNDLN
jgi:hypothetical protein